MQYRAAFPRASVALVRAGTCGGISVTLVGHPFDTLKVRLQTQPTTNPIYSGVMDCLKKTVQWEGLQGLYKVSITLMDVPRHADTCITAAACTHGRLLYSLNFEMHDSQMNA